MKTLAPTLVATALLLCPAAAQTSGTAPPASSPARPFIAQGSDTLMRASKLVGLDVIGLDEHAVGDVREVLLTREGQVDAVVIGVGGFLGVLAGFVGGYVNMAIMRTMDVFYAFPSVLLAVAISGTLGGGTVNGLLALTLVFVPAMCRVAESATNQVRTRDFVEAARASGAGTLSLILHHVLGNVLGPVFIYASSLISVSVLLASGLSLSARCDGARVCRPRPRRPRTDLPKM